MAGGGDADWRGSAALLAADPRGSAGRGDAESKGSCWPPRRRARQGERRPEEERLEREPARESGAGEGERWVWDSGWESVWRLGAREWMVEPVPRKP